MANVFATGAVHVFVSAGVYPAPAYFGTCEEMPQDNRQPQYEMLMNDISGSKTPLDLAFEGETAQISLVMTNWKEPLAQRLEAKPNPFIGASTPGEWRFEDVGSLIGFEGLALQLWLVYTFGSVAPKAAYVGNGLRPGRHYPQCVIYPPETEETGTKPMKRHFMFYAWPRLQIAQRKFVLYDFDFTGINASMIV